MNITVEATFYIIRVKINGITHIRIDRAKYLGHQSWCDADTCYKYLIEYILDGGSIVSEYTDREKWVEILNGLDSALGET